jgi:hypothetical protein
MRSELLAFLGFSRKGTEVLLGCTVGALLAAVLLNLIPMSTAARATLFALGAAVAIGVVASRPYGEDRGAWAIILGFALLIWVIGFAAAGIARALRRPH